MNTREKLLSKARNAHTIGGALILCWALFYMAVFSSSVPELLGALTEGWQIPEYLIGEVLKHYVCILMLILSFIILGSKRSTVISSVFFILSLAYPIIDMIVMDKNNSSVVICDTLLITAQILIILFAAIFSITCIACKNRRFAPLNLWFVVLGLYIIVVSAAFFSRELISSPNDLWFSLYINSDVIVGLYLLGIGAGMIMLGANAQNKADSYVDINVIKATTYESPELKKYRALLEQDLITEKEFEIKVRATGGMSNEYDN